MRLVTSLLIALSLTVLPACEESSQAKAPMTASQLRESLVESTAVTCKLARVQYGKLVQAYMIRFRRYPKTLGELKASGMIQGVIPCSAKGDYTIDERGAVVCSVHGK